MALPANISTGRVEGQFIVGVADGADPDDEPDFIPAQGTIAFTASTPYLPNPTATPNPVTMLKTTIVGILDSEGYVCTPDDVDKTKPGRRGIRLVATDDNDASVTGWTWTATPRFKDVNGTRLDNIIPAFSFGLPSDSTIDLTTVVKVPSAQGVGKEQIVALAAAANTAAQTAEEAALLAAYEASQAKMVAKNVQDRALAGEFNGRDGKAGEPGPAGPNTVPTQEAVAAYATTAGNPVNAAVAATISSKLGELHKYDSTIAALDMRVASPLVVAHCSDSTGYRSDQFFELAWKDMMARLWPERSARVKRWDKESSSYSAWEDWQTGTAPGVDFYNGGAPGTTPEYHLARLAAMYPVKPDLMVINHMHNFAENLSTSACLAIIQKFVDDLTALRGKFGVVVNSQNPRFGEYARPVHAERIVALRDYAAKQGWGYIPSYEAFSELPDEGRSLLLDDLHPAIGTGRVLQADVFSDVILGLSKRRALKTPAVPAEPEKPLHTLSVSGFDNRYAASEVEDPVGTAVASWQDFGPASKPLAQNSASARPVLATEDGIQCVSFDGVDDALYATSFSATEAEPLTVVMVAKLPWPTATKTIINASSRKLLRGATGNLTMSRTGTLANTSSTDGWHFYASVFDNTAARNHIDGSVTTGTIGTSTPTSGLTVGGSSRAHIAEFLVYRGALTEAQVASLRADMKAEYPTLA